MQKKEIECEVCGRHVKRYMSAGNKLSQSKHHYCSRECYAISITKGKEQPCIECGTEFHVAPSTPKFRNVQFCSKQCHGAHKRKAHGYDVRCDNCGKTVHKANNERSKTTGKTNYCNRQCQYDATHVGMACEHCFKPFAAKRRSIEGGMGGRFCSRKCFGLAERGPNNPYWRGGKPYSTDPFKSSKVYVEWRAAVYARDNYQCQKCDATDVEVHAHHIFAYKRYQRFRVMVANGITFCNDCHRLFHELYGTFSFKPEDTFEFLGSEYNIETHHELLIAQKGQA